MAYVVALGLYLGAAAVVCMAATTTALAVLWSGGPVFLLLWLAASVTFTCGTCLGLERLADDLAMSRCRRAQDQRRCA